MSGYGTLFGWFTYPVSYYHVQWGQKVFSQPLIMQVLLLRMMREVYNIHLRYTLTMRDKMRKKIQEITLYDF